MQITSYENNLQEVSTSIYTNQVYGRKVFKCLPEMPEDSRVLIFSTAKGEWMKREETDLLETPPFLNPDTTCESASSHLRTHLAPEQPCRAETFLRHSKHILWAFPVLAAELPVNLALFPFTYLTLITLCHTYLTLLNFHRSTGKSDLILFTISFSKLIWLWNPLIFLQVDD